MKTSTGHTLTLDLERMRLYLSGNVDTMDQIPEGEISAFCAASGVRCTYRPLDVDCYALAVLEEVRP